MADLSDRLGDGLAADYLHSGWWPTLNLPDFNRPDFNRPDVAIVIDAALLVLADSRWPRLPTSPTLTLLPTALLQALECHDHCTRCPPLAKLKTPRSPRAFSP